MICDSLECYSKAVARSRTSGQVYCIECALKVTKSFGPGSLETLSDASFPWEPISSVEIKRCPNCKRTYSEYLIGHTGECPACRETLEEYKDA